jgi:molecular chaperone GrpE
LAVTRNEWTSRRRLVVRRIEETLIVIRGTEPRPRGESPEVETRPDEARQTEEFSAEANADAGQDAPPQPADTAAPAASGPTGASEESSPEVALAAAEQDLAKHRDALLRMQAEMENLRKRLQREVEKSRKFALERIMKDLLQVRDSMDRGLEAGESATIESLREGQQLTLKMLAKVMQDHGLEVIDPLGQAFDPELHEAMTVMPSAEAAENTVLEVLQRGFRLHDRLLRPAMVVVSRRP